MTKPFFGAIQIVSDNMDLKRELRKSRTKRTGVMKHTPPGILRRILLAELYTLPRSLALQRLAEAGIALAA